MRFLKRLLVSIYVFLGVFAALCLVLWAVTGNEPTALITGVFAAAGVESMVGGVIKFIDSQEKKKPDADVPDGDMGRDGRAE